MFCVFCLDYVRLFWEWSKETETLKQRDVFWSQQLCFFFLCFSVFFFFLFFNFYFFFILGSDSKGIVRSCLITVLRTVWLNRRLNSSLLFGHRLVLKLKRTVIVRGSWFSRSDHTVRSGFKTMFQRTQILHVRRQGNVPTHTLAQQAKGIDTFVWLEETPSCIENSVFQDALYLSHSE